MQKKISCFPFRSWLRPKVWKLAKRHPRGDFGSDLDWAAPLVLRRAVRRQRERPLTATWSAGYVTSGEVGCLLVPGAEVTVDRREPLTWLRVWDRDSRRGPAGQGKTYPAVIESSPDFGENGSLRREEVPAQRRAEPTRTGGGLGEASSRTFGTNVM